MVEQATSYVEEGRERLSSARERIDDEIQRLQRDLTARRKRFERQFEKGRKSIERQARKQVRQIQGELRRSSLVKRVEELGSDAARQVEAALESVLGVLQVASKGDVQKIDRKLSKLSKRLKEIERSRQGNGRHAPTTL